ncbi:MAG: hypothetical protein ACRDUT_01995 [Mycobacterium sp.]
MLATFGLGRLEAGLVDNTLTASDVAEFLDQAEPVDVSTLAREGMPEALDCLHRRRIEEPTGRHSRTKSRPDPFLTAAIVSAAGQPGLSTPRHGYSRENPQFGTPRHANRV